MRIQHNIAALNSHRNMGINNSQTSKNLEKLSSGYRINRAGDDAAGLAISEKMRGQIRGLAMAEQNTQNGVSLIQTAEGGLNETHAILQRMRELAVQSSNGTYDEDVDRANLELEFQAIKSEIDRIAESTHYNGIKLLDGSLAGGTSKVSGTVAKESDIFKMLAAAGSEVDSPAAFTYAEGTPQVLDTAKLVDNFKTATKDDAAVREITVNFIDEDGNNQSITVRVNNINDDGTIEDWTKGDVGAVLTDALGATDLSKYFKIENDAGELTFTSLENGTEGAAHVTSIAINKLVDSTTTLAGDADTMRNTLNNTANDQKATGATVTTTLTVATAGLTDTTSGVAATLTITLDEFDVTEANMDWFELDGQKFRLTTASGINTGDTADDGAIYLKVDDTGALSQPSRAQNVIEELTGFKTTVAADGSTIELRAEKSAMTGAGVTGGNALVFQIGANGGEDQRVSLNVEAMDSKSIGSGTGKMLSDASIATRDSANAAIDIITDATNMVSAQRASLGALQNRLEHTLNNLGVTKENLTSAESLIRDVDMASEMMEFTKNQILVQASQAMLAQANQLPQGVLSLLR